MHVKVCRVNQLKKNKPKYVTSKQERLKYSPWTPELCLPEITECGLWVSSGCPVARSGRIPETKGGVRTIEGLEHPLLTFEESRSTSVLMGVCGKREVITGM